MVSKNNPLNRGTTQQKTFNGQVVYPVLYVSPEDNIKYISAESGNNLVINKSTNQPIAWADIA